MKYSSNFPFIERNTTELKTMCIEQKDDSFEHPPMVIYCDVCTSRLFNSLLLCWLSNDGLEQLVITKQQSGEN